MPTNWSQPEVIINDNGSRTIIPSIPQDFERQQFGAVLYTPRVPTIHGPYTRRRSQEPRQFGLRLRDGTRIEVTTGEQFTVEGRDYRLLGIHADELLVRSLSSGRIIRMARRERDLPSNIQPLH